MSVTGHIFIYGYIGTAPGETSLKTVKSAFSPSFDDYVVHIASGGGDVFEGYAIYNAIKNTGKSVTTHIEGVCASIATLVAAAGEKIVMNKMGQFMIHNPAVEGLKSADARKLRNVADQLDQMKTLLISVYQKRTGLTKDKLWELYDNETWLTSQQAQDMGFVDEQVDAIKAVAKITIPMNDNLLTKFLSWFKKQPAYKNQLTETIEGGELTGRSLIIMAEGEDIAGAQVILDSGEQPPPGTYQLASGKTITIDEAGIIAEVQLPSVEDAAEQTQEEPTNDDMKKDEEIAALKAQLEALQAEKNASAAQAQAQIEAVTNQFSNRFNELEASMKKFQTTTVGDQTPIKRGPAFKNVLENERYDPMGDEAFKYLKSRNAI